MCTMLCDLIRLGLGVELVRDKFKHDFCGTPARPNLRHPSKVKNVMQGRVMHHLLTVQVRIGLSATF